MIDLSIHFPVSVPSFLIGYVFLGIGLSRLAKAIGCSHPWLAWVPFGNLYLLGQVADIFTDNRMTTVADRDAPFYTPSGLRRKLLGYGIGSAVSGIAALVGLGLFAVSGVISFFVLLGAIAGGEVPSDTPSYMMALFTIGGLVAFAAGIICLVLTILLLTVYCPVLCRIFTALGVPSAALLTAVSVFVPALGAILIFSYTRNTEGLADRFAPPTF